MNGQEIYRKNPNVNDKLVFSSSNTARQVLDKKLERKQNWTSRNPWKKSMMSVMSWLRPEVTTCGDIYAGIEETENMEIDSCMDETVEGSSGCDPRDSTTGFNVAEFYDSIKPSKGEPMLDDELPDLLPTFRPYQRRAANWMVQREKGASGNLNSEDQNQFFRPLCATVCFLDTESKMFYNPFSGNISLHLESSLSYVSGGILAACRLRWLLTSKKSFGFS
ncbi:E3 ubiquitin-protein ligase SHPRH-like isoform X2 [Papaver somniferum]|uniref:E3 ubiquitin-protein ligase SHPRH-like isoform X2 n=1 Tax=Papaver somniferum TaxID=3469 RepID=UPI000E6F7501|nr:E3 ubiquitin-protein ligase SHPRH-like isoform X2 [Papaver somniferum]